MPTETKEGRRCKKCGEFKALEEFIKNPRLKGGRGGGCKACVHKARREKRAASKQIGPGLSSPKARERFWAKVQKDAPGGCWEWTGTLSNGYGSIWLDGKERRAHRVLFEYLNGPIPDELVLDHFACDNKRCVNPSHVRVVTNRENTLRSDSAAALNAAKVVCPKGHPYSGDNLYISPAGGRFCRQCHRDNEKRRAA